MSSPYLWNGTAWVQVPDVPSVSGSALLADTDQQTVTTLAQPTSPVSAGATVSLSATVKAGATPVTAGSVTFERLPPGGAWTVLGTDAASPWTANYVTPSTPGAYQFRAKYLGSGVYGASTSATRSVTVQAAAITTTINLYPTATRSYAEDGGYRSDNYDTRCYHGYYSSSQGQQRSALYFSVPANVKNSNVTSVKIRLTRIGSLGDSSCTINCGTHSNTSVQSNWNSLTRSPYNGDTFAADAWSSADNTTTYTLSSVIQDEFEQGAKGITIGPSSSNYCAFHGYVGVSSSERPYLTITYTYQP